MAYYEVMCEFVVDDEVFVVGNVFTNAVDAREAQLITPNIAREIHNCDEEVGINITSIIPRGDDPIPVLFATLELLAIALNLVAVGQYPQKKEEVVAVGQRQLNHIWGLMNSEEQQRFDTTLKEKLGDEVTLAKLGLEFHSHMDLDLSQEDFA